MKKLYKILLFLAMFQLVIIMVGLLQVFPYTFYSDVEMQDLQDIGTDPLAIMAYLFTPSDTSSFAQFTFAALLAVFTTVGIITAWATHSWTPVIITVIVVSFVPMVTNSFKFFNKLFTNWDVSAMVYLGICIMLGVFLITVFTILETPTHGRSG